MSNLRDIDQNPFWMAMKSNFNAGESIDSLLKSPNVTVEGLVEHESFVSECKSNNIKLIEFLCKKKNLKQLLKFIIEEPPEGCSHTRGHKLPFVVSEVLNAENPTLLDAIFRADGPDEEEPEDIEAEYYQSAPKETINDDANEINTLSNEINHVELESEIASRSESRDSRQINEDENKQIPDDTTISKDKENHTEANMQESDCIKDSESEDTKIDNDPHLQINEGMETADIQPSLDHEEKQDHNESSLDINKQEDNSESNKQNEEPITEDNSISEDQNLPVSSEKAPEKSESDEKQDEEVIPPPASSDSESSNSNTNASEELEPAKIFETHVESSQDSQDLSQTNLCEPKIEDVKEADQNIDGNTHIQENSKNIDENDDNNQEIDHKYNIVKEDLNDKHEPDDTANSETISNIVPNKHLIDILLDFIKKDGELNSVLCGYFCKLIGALMNHNRKEFASYIFNPKDDSPVKYLIKHIDNRSIADILVKILGEDSGDPDLQKQFVFYLLDSIRTQDLEGKLNSSLVLSEIIENKFFAEVFKSDDVNKELLDLLRLDSDLSVRAALNVATSLYKKYPLVQPNTAKSDDPNAFAKTYLSQSEENKEELEIPEHIDALLKEGLILIEEILSRETESTLDQQYGEIIKPFGATRLQAVKLIYHIITQGNTQYTLRLVPCLQLLLKHCVDFPYNSMLHNNVELIMTELFKKSSKYNEDVCTAIIAETGLPDYIADLTVDSQMPTSGRSIRSGVIATFINIANLLLNHESEYVQQELNRSDKWNYFVNTELASSNANNERALAGHRSKACDSDDESVNYETSMDKLFSIFTQLKESHDSSRELDESEIEDINSTPTDSQPTSVNSKNINSSAQESQDKANPSEPDTEPLNQNAEKSQQIEDKTNTSQSNLSNPTDRILNEITNANQTDSSESQNIKNDSKVDVPEGLGVTNQKNLDEETHQKIDSDENEEAKISVVSECLDKKELSEQINTINDTLKQLDVETSDEPTDDTDEPEDSSMYYNPMYWELPSSFKLDDLIQDNC